MTTILKEWSELAGFESPALDQSGNLVLALDDGDVLISQHGDMVVVTAAAGSLSEAADPDALLGNLLEANFLWRQTSGFTCALADDDEHLFLQDAHPVNWFGSGEGFADYLANLSDARQMVRGLLGQKGTEA